MSDSSKNVTLNDAQLEEAERIYQHLRDSADGHLREISQLMASKPDSELFGETEFQVRDLLNKIGAQAVQATLDERHQKKTTT